jgi:hypothetical protein
MFNFIAQVVSFLMPHALAVSYNLAIPGDISVAGNGDPAGILVNFYQFGMLLAGILAFGMVVWAGIQYSLSRGNAAGQTDARDKVIQAFLGILLLVGAYAILYTLNPGLTRLQLPQLSPIDPKAIVAQTPAGYDIIFDLEEPVDTPKNALPTTGGCVGNPSNCRSLTDLGLQCSGNHCGADQSVARIISCALTSTGRTAGTLSVGDAYPPAGSHLNPRHQNGCAVDLVINNYQNCNDVTALLSSMKTCGGVPLNEYLRCGGVKTPNRKPGNEHDHIHLNGCN